jgi:fibronectin type 3 domain-containing protein
MRYTDTATKPGVKHRYEVIALNTAGLKSQAAKAR